jgi:hypothetical protein
MNETRKAMKDTLAKLLEECRGHGHDPDNLLVNGVPMAELSREDLLAFAVGLMAHHANVGLEARLVVEEVEPGPLASQDPEERRQRQVIETMVAVPVQVEVKEPRPMIRGSVW